MWWMYFDRPVHDLLTSLTKAIVWGYGHYLVFAAAAAVGAGLAVSVDQATHHAKVSAAGAGFAVAVPVAVFVCACGISTTGRNTVGHDGSARSPRGSCC